MPRAPIGVILSAGKGSRIDPFNTHFPKPMLPILNRPIIEHQIDQMKEVGVEEVLIVVGHLKEHIINHVGDGSRFVVRTLRGAAPDPGHCACGHAARTPH